MTRRPRHRCAGCFGSLTGRIVKVNGFRLCARCAPVADEVMEIVIFETEVAITQVNAVTEIVRDALHYGDPR